MQHKQDSSEQCDFVKAKCAIDTLLEKQLFEEVDGKTVWEENLNVRSGDGYEVTLMTGQPYSTAIFRVEVHGEYHLLPATQISLFHNGIRKFRATKEMKDFVVSVVGDILNRCEHKEETQK